MKPTTTGLHHVTAIASDLRRNVAFYTDLLGLRLVKKTVNFDDPSAYHLYYGDETGAPGTIVTFFFWPGGQASRGRVGVGQMTAIPFSAPTASLAFWAERLRTHGVAAKRQSRWGEDVVAFNDPDGLPLEIVGSDGDARPGWTADGVPAQHAIRGLFTAPLSVRDAEATAGVLTREMGYRLVRADGPRARYAAGTGGPGTFVDVIEDPTGRNGLGGAGTIHHIAWRVPDDEAQAAVQDQLENAGLQVSGVRDRNYFRSIYFRERNGLLFEVATDTPGFAVDEPMASLGHALKLPVQFEAHRAAIEAVLPPLPNGPLTPAADGTLARRE